MQVSNVDQLAQQLLDVGPCYALHVIGIDGKDGSGKTCLAYKVGRRICGSVISLDDFVDANRGEYVRFLRVEELRKRIYACSGPVVLEGVCLLAAVKNLAIQLTSHVYVKRMSHGVWADEDECDPKESADTLIARREAELQQFTRFERVISSQADGCSSEPTQLPELEKEVIRYHAHYRPMDRADFIIERQA